MVLPVILGGIAAAGALYSMYKNAKDSADQRKAQGHQLALMQDAAKDYEHARPQYANARRNAYMASVAPYQGANNALVTMYGAQNAQPMAPPLQPGQTPPPPMGSPDWEKWSADQKHQAEAARNAALVAEAEARERAKRQAAEGMARVQARELETSNLSGARARVMR